MFVLIVQDSPKCPPDVEAHDVEPGERRREPEVDAVPCANIVFYVTIKYSILVLLYTLQYSFIHVTDIKNGTK